MWSLSSLAWHTDTLDSFECQVKTMNCQTSTNILSVWHWSISPIIRTSYCSGTLLCLLLCLNIGGYTCKTSPLPHTVISLHQVEYLLLSIHHHWYCLSWSPLVILQFVQNTIYSMGMDTWMLGTQHCKIIHRILLHTQNLMHSTDIWNISMIFPISWCSIFRIRLHIVSELVSFSLEYIL